MNFFKSIIALILLLVLFSCSKEEGGKTVLNGLVLDETTDDPVGRAQLYLERQEKDCSTCTLTQEATTKANDDGGFNFNFEASGEYDYFVRATKSGYYENLATARVQVKTGEGSTPVLRIQPEGYIKLLIKNTSPLNANDEIRIVGGNTFIGATVDTTDVILGLGNKSNIVQWVVTRNGSPNSYSTQIQVVAFDTVSYTLNY